MDIEGVKAATARCTRSVYAAGHRTAALTPDAIIVWPPWDPRALVRDCQVSSALPRVWEFHGLEVLE